MASFTSSLLKGSMDRRGGQVEHRVNDGDVEGVGLVMVEGELEHGVQGIETAEEHRGADNVEIQVDHGGTAGVLVAPAEEISAVTQVPMFWPMMMGMAAAMDTAPVEMDSACRIPTEAEKTG